MRTDDQIVKNTEMWAKKNGFNWKCVNPRAGKKGRHNLVIMKCLISNKISMPKLERVIKDGQNIFLPRVLPSDYIIKKINQIGKTTNPQFICVNPRAGKLGRNNLVEIESIKTKDRCIRQQCMILSGKNPFNHNQNRIEVLSVQPKYERLLKKLKILFVKEFKLGKKSIDFVFTIKNKKYGLEVKQSNKKYYQKNQLETYRKLANLSQYKLEKVFLSNPKGSHSSKGSISIQEFETILKNLLQK
jgi:hypothetical protein